MPCPGDPGSQCAKIIISSRVTDILICSHPPTTGHQLYVLDTIVAIVDTHCGRFGVAAVYSTTGVLGVLRIPQHSTIWQSLWEIARSHLSGLTTVYFYFPSLPFPFQLCTHFFPIPTMTYSIKVSSYSSHKWFFTWYTSTRYQFHATIRTNLWLETLRQCCRTL